MHNSVLSKRNHAAHTRIVMLAGLIASVLKIDPKKVDALSPKNKDRDVRVLMQREATAALLDDIALQLGIDLPTTGTAIDDPDAATVEPTGDQETADGQEPAGDQDPEGDQDPDGDEDGDQAGESALSAELPPPVVDDEE